MGCLSVLENSRGATEIPKLVPFFVVRGQQVNGRINGVLQYYCRVGSLKRVDHARGGRRVRFANATKNCFVHLGVLDTPGRI